MVDESGDTSRDPDAETSPMVVIETEEALAVVQVSFEEPPGWGMELKVAVSVQAGRGPCAGVTVTVFWQVTVPPGPVAVRV